MMISFLRLDAVHLDQERIERLLAFVVAAAMPVRGCAHRRRFHR